MAVQGEAEADVGVVADVGVGADVEVAVSEKTIILLITSTLVIRV